MTPITDNFLDQQDSIDGDGGAFANKAYFSNSIVDSQALAPTIPLSTFIGLADLVYNDSILNQTEFNLDGTNYSIIASKDDEANSYQGFVVYDEATNSVFVVNRGSKEAEDFVVDAEMAVTAVNSQWSDALALANVAATYASSHNNATVYAVGHSLGGTLAELQAADFGWVGYTFNAYGASDVFNALGLTQSPKASVHNYRTLFDVVSDASTHLGNQPIVLESAADVALLASGSSASPKDLIETIAGDHSLSNFFAPGSDASSGNGYNFVAANGFSVPASGQIVALAEDLVSGLALSLRLGISAVASVATGAPVNIPVGDLTVAQAAEEAWQYMNDQSVSESPRVP